MIDHTGKFLEPVAPDHAAFKSLLRLLDTGRCWVKLSAPYETSKTGAPKYEDVGRLAKALVKHAPERMLWASQLAASLGAQAGAAPTTRTCSTCCSTGRRRRSVQQENPRRQSRRALRILSAV